MARVRILLSPKLYGASSRTFTGDSLGAPARCFCISLLGCGEVDGESYALGLQSGSPFLWMNLAGRRFSNVALSSTCSNSLPVMGLPQFWHVSFIPEAYHKDRRGSFYGSKWGCKGLVVAVYRRSLCSRRMRAARDEATSEPPSNSRIRDFRVRTAAPLRALSTVADAPPSRRGIKVTLRPPQAFG